MNKLDKIIDKLLEQDFSDAEFGEFSWKELFTSWNSAADGPSLDVSDDLTELVNVLGYNDLYEFFSDNPAAGDAVFEWVSDLKSPPSEWVKNLRDVMKS